MHEFSLMADLFKKIYNIISQENVQKVISVNVRLGALCHISPEHFREHFVDAAKDSIIKNAQLNIEVSSDINDPNAQNIILQEVEVI